MENNKNIRAVKGTASHRNVADSMAESMMPEDLAKMKDMDIREAEAGKLADILEIEIDKDISDIEKRGNLSGRSEIHTFTGRENILLN